VRSHRDCDGGDTGRLVLSGSGAATGTRPRLKASYNVGQLEQKAEAEVTAAQASSKWTTSRKGRNAVECVEGCDCRK
jgi:hypothetical protein